MLGFLDSNQHDPPVGWRRSLIDRGHVKHIRLESPAQFEHLSSLS